ncbi:MAG: prepilin-type N-terminal cleavage/methylation domain-containing protein [Candidatus Omnitrophica bacterium]|nr:prepilin-type N-terminal cleavage/methylation domain-containing protein [Candidatus Omnitrophota bacterium]
MKVKNTPRILLQLFIKDKRAFSLVETLITMVIMVVVFVSGLMIFSSITLRATKQAAEKTMTASARDLAFFLRHSLKEAIIQDIEGPFRIDFIGTETSIKYVSPYTPGSGSDLGKYGIYFNGDEIMLSFERLDRNMETYAFDSGFSGSQPLVENVKMLSFSYWDGNTWEKSWNTQNQIGRAKLPDKIKVFFVLRAGKFEGKEIEKIFEEEIWMGR